MKPFRCVVGLVAALSLSVSLSGCGGGDDDSDRPDSASVAPSVDPDDVDNAIDDIADDADISDECQFLLKLALAPGLVASGQLDPETLEGFDAPPELADDIKVYLDALLEYVDDPTGDGAAAMSTEEFADASQHISEYAEEHCPDFG